MWQFGIEYAIASVLHTVATIRLVLILASIRRTTGDRPSFFLVALLINWLVLCVLILPYEYFGVASWRPNDNGIRNGYILFALGLLPHVFGLALIPVSIFYLTLERIFIILWNLQFGRRHRRRLMVAYGLTLALGVAVVGTGFYLASQQLHPLMPCMVNGCILGQDVLVYLGWRALCALFNFSFGIAFLVMLYRFQSIVQQSEVKTASSDARHKTQKANNFLTIMAIVNEFFLAFLPHFFPFIWEQVNGPGSSMWTGPLSEIASAIEVTILTTIYGRVFTALPSGSNHPITVATVAPELPVANLSANRIGSGSSANRFPPPVVRKLSEVPAEQRHVSSEGRLSAPPPTKTTESDTFHVSRVGGTPSIGVLPQPSSASPRIQFRRSSRSPTSDLLLMVVQMRRTSMPRAVGADDAEEVEMARSFTGAAADGHAACPY